MPDEPWREQAACKDKPTKWFIPDGSGKRYHKAKALCKICKVKKDCLTYAIEFPVPLDGIWGGTSKKERAKMRGKSGKNIRRRNSR